MGFLWDILQESRISDQGTRVESLEQRVEHLEQELYRTRKILHTLVARLEERFGEDINGDGKIG